MSITVRRAEPEEAAVVHRMMHAAFEDYRGRLDPPSGAHAETVDDVRAVIERGGAFLAFDGDVAVGSARFRLFPGYAYAERVSVLPAYRGRGVAAALMSAFEAAARVLGLPEARVGVRKSLPANLRLYERLGYRVVSEVPYATGADVDITLARPLPG